MKKKEISIFKSGLQSSTLRNPVLPPRLLAAAEMCKGPVAADIGCDHGLLSAFLLESGRCSKIFARDIRPGPLSSASALFEKKGLSMFCDCSLGDGLQKLPLNEISDVFILGMGGERIADILIESKSSCFENMNFVLSPMTRAAELRRRISEAGFEIVQECAVVDTGKAYTVMRAGYTGNKTTPDEIFCHTGLVDPSTPQGTAFLRRELNSLRKRARNPETAEKMNIIIEGIEKLL